MWNKGWDKVFKNSDWGKYPGEELIRFIARNFYDEPNRKDIRILEVGCGIGANLWFLAREGFNTYGIDGSQIAIEQAKSYLAGEGLVADIQKGDAMYLPYPDLTFDAVIDVECIYANSLVDSEKILNEVYRVLKPDGAIFSKTFSTGMSGENSAKNLINEPHTYVKMPDGPLRDDYGVIRLTDESEITKIYHLFRNIEYDLITRTDKNRSNKLSEWVIQGIK